MNNRILRYFIFRLNIEVAESHRRHNEIYRAKMLETMPMTEREQAEQELMALLGMLQGGGQQ